MFVIGLVFGLMVPTIWFKVWVPRIEAQRDAEMEGEDRWWTVVGVWTLSKERWSLHVEADDARQAEDLAQHEARFDVGKELWVTGVFKGKLDNADKYATFVDPDVKPTDWLNHGSENPL